MNDNKKILVTGAGGGLGHVLVTKLCDYGYDVVATDIKTDGIDPRAKIIKIDIFNDNINNFYELFDCPDICIHMAWQDVYNLNSLSHINLFPMHFRFLKQMIDSGLKSLAVMGTMHEIGYHEGVVKSDTQCNPQNMYGIAKCALREALDIATKDCGCCFYWLRAFYTYGGEQYGNTVLAKILRAAKLGETTFPLNSGKNLYDYESVDMLCEQIIATISQTKYSGIIQCCSGQPISLAEKVEQFIKENNISIKIEYGKFPDRPFDSPGIWGDSSIIDEILSQARCNN